ncbi:MAG: type VI secretion system tip protein VgrG [Myxococcaceae bacterium]|nr:MAG: type VI secretion system tip protein VgrG [Myxococcaceae bacterium]
MSNGERRGDGAAEDFAEGAHTAEEAAERAATDAERVRRLAEARNVGEVLRPALELGGEFADLEGAVNRSPVARGVASGMRAASSAIGAVSEGIHAYETLRERAAEQEREARRLPPVEWHFESAGTHRPWRMRRAEVREGLSRVTVTELELTCEHADADPALLLGRDATFSLTRDGRSRRVQGVVSRVEALGVRDHKAHARVTLVPALWALSQRRDSRVFEGKTVEQVVRAVVEEALRPYRRRVRFAIQRALPVREHCVQYRESDLEFVERLLAEEGLGYLIAEGEAHEEVVFFDGPQAFTGFDGPDGRRIAVTDEEHDTHRHESLRRFEAASALTSTSAVAMDYDWTNPSLRVVHENRSADPAGVDREVYVHPAAVIFDRYDAGDHAYERNDVAHRATLEAQRHLQRARTFTGEGSVTALRPGMLFRLEGHRVEAMEQEYLVTEVRHRCAAAEETRDGHREGAEEPYRNEVTCVPSTVSVRPELRHRRARIHGPQTARVVSAGGDEVETEHYGRVRVRFHWERDGRSPEDAQRAWVRVAQAWAGNGFGFVFVPRKDMEVVVQFIDGDPDRPLITGGVYNGTHPPPYDLERPEAVTRSVIRTQSTPGGDPAHYNELSFQDQSGREEVFLRAERDLREEVLHDHATHVHAAQSNTVDASQTERIGVDQSVRVQRDRKGVIDRDDQLLVRRDREAKVLGDDTQGVVGEHRVRIDGREERVVSGKGRDTTIETKDELTVNGISYTHVRDGYTVMSDASIGLMAPSVQLDAANVFQIVRGGDTPARPGKPAGREASVTFDPDGMKVESVLKVRIECGGSTVVLLPDGTVTVTGSKSIKATCGQSSMELKPSEVIVRGGTIKLNP